MRPERWKGASQVKTWGQHQHQDRVTAMTSVPKKHQEELCQRERRGDGLREGGRSWIRCDLQVKARSLGFSLSVMGSALVCVRGWYDLIYIFKSNRWRMGQERKQEYQSGNSCSSERYW